LAVVVAQASQRSAALPATQQRTPVLHTAPSPPQLTTQQQLMHRPVEPLHWTASNTVGPRQCCAVAANIELLPTQWLHSRRRPVAHRRCAASAARIHSCSAVGLVAQQQVRVAAACCSCSRRALLQLLASMAAAPLGSSPGSRSASLLPAAPAAPGDPSAGTKSSSASTVSSSILLPAALPPDHMSSAASTCGDGRHTVCG
jgi:hypothetical protein